MEGEHESDRLARLRKEPDQPGANRLRSRISSVEITWEKSILGFAAILIVCAVIGAVAVLARSGGVSGRAGQPPLVSHVLPATRTPRPASSTLTALPTSTAVVVAPKTLDRTDCDSIRGTNYRSDAERQYYISRCVTVVQPVPSVPPAVEPTEPPPPTEFAASDAISAASDWITHRAGTGYATDPGSCNAVQIGGHWVVTCQASLVGCVGGPECQTNVSVCVFVDPVVVRAADQC